MRILSTLVVGTLALASPCPSYAIGTFQMSSSDLITTTSLSENPTIFTLSGLTFGTVTVGTVALAIEIEEMKPSAQSPHHNVTIISNGLANTAAPRP